MPSLHLFQRPTFIGGDDLQPGCLIAILIRSLQLLFLVLPLLIHSIQQQIPHQKEGGNEYDNYNHFYDSCRTTSSSSGSTTTRQRQMVLVYSLLSATYLIFCISLELRIMKTSSLGTPTQHFIRNPTLTKLLEFRLLHLSIIHILLFSFGCVAMDSLCVGGGANDNNGRAIIEEYGEPYYNNAGTINNNTSIIYGSNYNYYNNYRDMQDQNQNQNQSQQNNNDENEDKFHYFSIENIWILSFTLLLTMQAFEVLFSIISIAIVFFRPKRWASPHQNHHHHYTLSTTTTYEGADGATASLTLDPIDDIIWENRCRMLCKCSGLLTCFFFGGETLHVMGEYQQISIVLTDYLDGIDKCHLDIVPSDVVAAFILLRQKQKYNEEKKRNRVIQQIIDKERRFNRRNTHVDDEEEGTRATGILGTEGGGEKLYISLDEYNSTRDTKQLILSNENTIDCNLLLEGARYARLALAIYTWLLYVYVKPLNGLYELNKNRLFCCFQTMKKCQKSSSSSNNNDDDNDEIDNENFYDENNDDTTISFRRHPSSLQTILGDNIFEYHKNAFFQHINDGEGDILKSQHDLVYANFSQKDIYDTPYAITLDHEWKTCVLSIRGTLSLEDCLTNVIVDAASLEELGNEYGFDGRGEFCHSGMVTKAKWLMKDLETHGTLEKLLQQRSSKGNNKQQHTSTATTITTAGASSTPYYPDYRLVIVGHSLGAGVGTLLGLMLRKRYPNLRCITYSPPGSFVTLKTALKCKEFVTSFVIGQDIVARLSVYSMHHLRDEILKLIGQIRVPKIKVFQSIFKNQKGQQEEDNDEDPSYYIGDENAASASKFYSDNDQHQLQSTSNSSSMLYPEDEIPNDTEYAIQLKELQRIQIERNNIRELNEQANAYVPLYPPGKIIHLVETTTSSSQSDKKKKKKKQTKQTEYTPMYADNEKDFTEIIISPSMGTDHIPSKMCVVLEQVAEDFGINIRKDRFDESLLLVEGDDGDDEESLLFMNENIISSSSTTSSAGSDGHSLVAGPSLQQFSPSLRSRTSSKLRLKSVERT